LIKNRGNDLSLYTENRIKIFELTLLSLFFDNGYSLNGMVAMLYSKWS